MKRFFCFVLFIVFLPVISFADLPDISSLSYDELVQLKNQINLAIWNSSEWQEVTVPAGVWTIGEDIPEGYWTVTPKDSITSFWYGDKLNDSKTNAGYGWDYNTGVAVTLNGRVNSDGSWKYPDEQHSVSIEMKSGMFVIIKEAVIFTPYSGKPDLGFK